MASENDEKGKSVSFTFSKKKPASKLVRINKEYCNEDEKPFSGKDYVHSAEGKLLQSTNPKETPKELVIPCLPRNDALFARMKQGSANELDKEAAEEIITDLSKTKPVNDESGNNFAIPLLAKTHLATPNETNDDATNTTQVSTSQESSLEDYNAVPVAAFGAAMLRGMGWKKGEAIGGTNKGLTVPIEFIPRSQGLGLGAERQHEDNVKKKRRKPGDTESSQHSGPIIEKDGRVRHFKGLDEKIPDKQAKATTYSKGGYVVVTAGPHKQLSGKITALDEDNARIFVRLGINNEDVTLSQHNVRLVDRNEYKEYLKGNSSEHDGNNHRKNKRRRDEKYREDSPDYSSKKPKPKHKEKSCGKSSTKESSRDKHGHESSEESSGITPCWMAPLIRVRIISKSFRKGKYYHKKVIIQDVISRTTCICKTDEGRLLEDVPQSVLETVIPKTDPRFILFVQGKHKNSIGEIVQTESSKQEAIIQILRDKSVVRCHYDDISEYMGDVHRE